MLGSPPSIRDREEETMPPTTTAGTGVEADVLSADDRRFGAMRSGDWATLDALLADDLTYVHSTARDRIWRA